MTSAVEKMAYTGETPWHGLGFKVSNDLSPAQMLKAAHLDWTVSKREMFIKRKSNGQLIEVPDRFALTRDSDETPLSIVGAVYRPTQNADAISFFQRFTTAGQMLMETAGSLWGGRYTWALARVGKDFKLGKSDEVRTFLLLASPHVHGKSLIIQFTPIRVVCWNTLNFALGKGLKGDQHAFRMPHTHDFDEEVQKRATQALGLAVSQAETFKEAATLLSKRKAAETQVEEYFCEVLKFDPAKANKKKDGELKLPRMLPMFREALTHAPGQQLGSALGTWWGALNAVTHVIDHQVGRERDTALKGAWFGYNTLVKQRAVDLALKAAA